MYGEQKRDPYVYSSISIRKFSLPHSPQSDKHVYRSTRTRRTWSLPDRPFDTADSVEIRKADAQCTG